MNIKEAKQQIKNAMTAYFTKDEFGSYIIPIERQRPVILMGPPGGKVAFKLIKSELEKYMAEIKKDAKKITSHLDNTFAFCESVFPDGQEILILVTELTVGYYTAHHISRYGCDSYFRHNKELLFHERQLDIITQLEELHFE